MAGVSARLQFSGGDLYGGILLLKGFVGVEKNYFSQGSNLIVEKNYFSQGSNLILGLNPIHLFISSIITPYTKSTFSLLVIIES